jgi:hypothetical protein
LPGGIADARSFVTAAERVAALPHEVPAHTHEHGGTH